MFFVLSKVFGFVAQPSNFLALICAAGVLLYLIGRRRAGLRLGGTGLVLLLIAGYSPLGHVLLLTLTERFPAWQADGPAPDGIIILGGAIDPDLSRARDQLEVDASAERVIAMLELARRFPQARIVFSGGSARLITEGAAEAPLAGALLRRFEIDRSRILLETESRTTAENARLTRELVQPKPGARWLLVTSAFHMPRSIAAFRAAGFPVEAFPVDWRTRGWRDAMVPFRRLSAGLARVDVAVHEWVGLIAYRLTGRSAALLPGP